MPQTGSKTHYQILEVPKDASTADIKKSYRRLARKYHPDTNQGSKKAENHFKRISAAYEILKDKNKRRDYDQRSSQRGGPRRARNTGWSDAEDRYGYGFGDFNRQQEQQDPFARTQTQEDVPPDPNAPRAGFDLQYMIDVPFITVMLGGTVPYAYEKYVNCSQCGGAGTNGEGSCATCKGKRWEISPVNINVKIPPGVADQYTLRLDHLGGEGLNAGPPGNLFLKICTQPHPRFKRFKNDILAEVPISSELAEQGGSLEIEMLDSVRTIQIEEGTLTGEELRIKGEGAAIMWGKNRGDFVLKFKVTEE